MDASQSISFTAYDAATGAVDEQIQDVNFTDNCSDQQFQSSLGLIPASWPQPTTGQNLITKYVVHLPGPDD